LISTIPEPALLGPLHTAPHLIHYLALHSLLGEPAGGSVSYAFTYWWGLPIPLYSNCGGPCSHCHPKLVSYWQGLGFPPVLRYL